MKKIILSLVCLLLVGCSNGLKEEYDLVVKENAELKTQIQDLSTKLSDYKKELDTQTQKDEKGKVKISGGLVLTVDAKLNDPNVGIDNFNTLVVRPFQSNPEILVVDEEIVQKVKVGETYFFEIKTKTIHDVTYDEVVDTINLDLGAMQWLEVVDVREPLENEYGLAENLHIEKLDKCYKFGYDTVIQNLEQIKSLLK